MAAIDEQIARVRRDIEAREDAYVHALGSSAKVILSYEAARDVLAELDWLRGSDPLAALEAAERRLLEAGGWIEITAGIWAVGGARESATRARAVAIERRRLAAKGGA